MPPRSVHRVETSGIERPLAMRELYAHGVKIAPDMRLASVARADSGPRTSTTWRSIVCRTRALSRTVNAPISRFSTTVMSLNTILPCGT